MTADQYYNEVTLKPESERTEDEKTFIAKYDMLVDDQIQDMIENE